MLLYLKKSQNNYSPKQCYFKENKIKIEYVSLNVNILYNLESRKLINLIVDHSKISKYNKLEQNAM